MGSPINQMEPPKKVDQSREKHLQNQIGAFGNKKQFIKNFKKNANGNGKQFGDQVKIRKSHKMAQIPQIRKKVIPVKTEKMGRVIHGIPLFTCDEHEPHFVPILHQFRPRNPALHARRIELVHSTDQKLSAQIPQNEDALGFPNQPDFLLPSVDFVRDHVLENQLHSAPTEARPSLVLFQSVRLHLRFSAARVLGR